jgi:hypothetical protein
MSFDYSMFSEEGNLVVADLVLFSRLHNLPYDVVMAMMSAISKDERFGEITDTAVRECIGAELGWYK